MEPRVVNALTALGFGLPFFGYFWFLEHFSLNVVVGDQWAEVPIIRQSYIHFFPWGAMWLQHNENRIFFENVIVVLLTHTAHFNVQFEEYLGALMLAAATVCLLWAHKRRSPFTPWLYYCPVAFLLFSVVQEGNTIWGFQVGWYLVLISLAVGVLLLDTVVLTWVTLLGGVAAAVVGSFSSLQGLLIWPTGLVLLYFRRRSLAQTGTWIAAAVASTAFYFHNYNSASTPDPGFARHYPFYALKFYLLTVGDVVGRPITGRTTLSVEDIMVMLFGLVIVLLAVATVLLCSLRRDERAGSPIGIALIGYGLLFPALITQGRSFFGYAAAGFSRYTTFDLLTLVGIYLALLGRGYAIDAGQKTANRLGPRRASVLGGRHARTGGGGVDRVALSCAQVVVLIAIAVQIPFGLYDGVHGARVEYAQLVREPRLIRNDTLSELTLFGPPPSYIRQQVQTLKEHHLSLFVNG